MTEVYLGLGSNMGDRERHLAYALHQLRRAGELTGVSAVYQTEPVGYLDQPTFLNLVARLETDLDPEALLALARETEAERRRERSFRNAPRTLDIDVLLYGDRTVDLEGLTVPHPRMNDRAFVLVPLLELDPLRREPGSGRSYADILAAAGGAQELEPYMPGPRLLELASEVAPEQ